MKLGEYLVTMLLGLACLALTVSLMVVAGINMRQQARLQARQMQMNNSVLGPQAQQIGGQLLQELAAAATTNMAIRQALLNQGYQLNMPPASAPLESPDGSALSGNKAVAP